MLCFFVLCLPDMQTTTVKNSGFRCKNIRGSKGFDYLRHVHAKKKRSETESELRKAAQLQSGYDANCVQSSHNLILFISGWP